MIVPSAAAPPLAYGLVPPQFSRERDFVLLLFAVLNAILVVSLLIARAYYRDFDASVDVHSWAAFAPEMSAILQAIGVQSSVPAVTGATAPGLSFAPLYDPVVVTVVITTVCLWIHSFGIFASAFVASVLTEYELQSRRVWLLLALGFVTSFAANILRMFMSVLVGHYTDRAETGLQNVLLAHSYVGCLVLLAWIGFSGPRSFDSCPRSNRRSRPKKAHQR